MTSRMAGMVEGNVRCRERNEQEQAEVPRRAPAVPEGQEAKSSAEPLFETDKYRRAVPLLKPDQIRI